MQTAKEDIHDDEDISTETIVAPPLEEEEEELYENDVPRLPVEAAEDDIEDEEKFYFQKFLATRRGRGSASGGGGGGGWDRSKSLPSVHANGGVSYRLLGRKNFSGFGGLLDRVLEHGGGSDHEDGGELREEDEEEEDGEGERRERIRSIRYVSDKVQRRPGKESWLLGVGMLGGHSHMMSPKF